MGARPVPFGSRHLDQAAALVATRIQAQRDASPLLPPTLESPQAVLPHLASLLERGAGIALEEGARLVGFLAALDVPLFGGTPGAYAPEWAHGAAAGTGLRTYRELYRGAAAAWAERGWSTHAVTLLALDRGAEQVLFEHGFGLVVVDAIAPLDPAPAEPPPGFTIRAAATADAPLLARLDAELARHLAAPPAFRVPEDEPATPDAVADRIARGSGGVVAEQDGEVVAWVSGAPADGTYPLSAAGPGVVRIDGAYAVPAVRRSGVAGALVRRFLADAAAAGHRAGSVDYESANPEAVGFWPAAGFVPFARSLVRFVAPRLVA